MIYNIQEVIFTNVAEKAQALGCNIPTGIALLPRNFETANQKSELVHEGSVPDVRILWRQAGISETPLENKGERFPQAQEKSFVEWSGPIIFVSGALLSHNPEAISIALGVITNYLTDWFKGFPNSKKVKLDVVVEDKGKCRRIHYSGDVAGLEKIPEIIERLTSND